MGNTELHGLGGERLEIDADYVDRIGEEVVVQAAEIRIAVFDPGVPWSAGRHASIPTKGLFDTEPGGISGSCRRDRFVVIEVAPAPSVGRRAVCVEPELLERHATRCVNQQARHQQKSSAASNAGTPPGADETVVIDAGVRRSTKAGKATRKRTFGVAPVDITFKT